MGLVHGRGRKKGFWHLVEAIISASIVILFLTAIVSRQALVPPGPNVLIQQGFEELRDLDKKGVLREYVVNRNNTGLDAEVQLLFFNHSTQICDTDSSCAGTAPTASNVWVATYLVAGKYNYTPYEVILYMWQD